MTFGASECTLDRSKINAQEMVGDRIELRLGTVEVHRLLGVGHGFAGLESSGGRRGLQLVKRAQRRLSSDVLRLVS